MKIGSKCTTCHDRVEEESAIECETCGRELHDSCETYVTTFECNRCGDETWIGACEF